MLFKKDFLKLNKNDFKILADFETKKEFSVADIMDFPKHLYIYKTAFPNFNLKAYDFDNPALKNWTKKFKQLIEERKVKESDVVKFIKENKLYFIIGGILTNFSFGHHEAYLFPEVPLSNNYVCDYLLIGTSSYGYEFVFVEFESINENITLKNGDLGESIRKGLKQINDWKMWNDSNFISLRTYFKKHLSPDYSSLPTEFIDYDSTRFHYVIVAGKRKHYNDYTRLLQRKLKRNESTLLVHYDNLVDWALQIIESKNYIKNNAQQWL